MTFRKIPRDVHEDARDATRALMGTPEFAKSRNERKKVEMRFAHLKTHHRFERMRLRGLSGARDEFHLAAIALTGSPIPRGGGSDPNLATWCRAMFFSSIERIPHRNAVAIARSRKLNRRPASRPETNV